MLYKVIVYRKDGSKLEIKADNLTIAKDVAGKYNKQHGVSVAITETRVVYLRLNYQGDLLEEEE